jgi:hypothetical protein
MNYNLIESFPFPVINQIKKKISCQVSIDHDFANFGSTLKERRQFPPPTWNPRNEWNGKCRHTELQTHMWWQQTNLHPDSIAFYQAQLNCDSLFIFWKNKTNNLIGLLFFFKLSTKIIDKPSAQFITFPYDVWLLRKLVFHLCHYCQ